MISIIGVDPGGTTGVARLSHSHAGYVVWEAFEVPSKDDLVDVLLERYEATLFEPKLERVHFAVEDFVIGNRAGRSRSATAGALARKYIGQLELLAMNTDSTFAKRPASVVKTWAGDSRLEAIAAIEPTKGLPHARDALRHALFAARRDMQWPDPLSRAYSS